MQEIWKPASGFEDFIIVSNNGDVRSIPREYISITPQGKSCIKRVHGKLLKQYVSNSGYMRVGIGINGKIYTVSVHRLVALTFIINPNRFKQVNHIDGNKCNNIVNNLEWCSASNNQIHAIKLGLVTIKKGTERAFAKLDDDSVRAIRDAINKGVPYKIISKNFGVCPSKITFIKQGKAWKHVI